MRQAWMTGIAMMWLTSATGSGGAGNVRPQFSPQPQTGGQVQIPQRNTKPSILDEDTGPNPVRDRMQEQARRGRNTERFKRMVADTNRLLQLSTELKEDVDKTTKDEMSVQVIQKAAEIEKLAHDVKERMKGQ